MWSVQLILVYIDDHRLSAVRTRSCANFQTYILYLAGSELSLTEMELQVSLVAQIKLLGCI